MPFITMALLLSEPIERLIHAGPTYLVMCYLTNLVYESYTL